MKGFVLAAIVAALSGQVLAAGAARLTSPTAGAFQEGVDSGRCKAAQARADEQVFLYGGRRVTLPCMEALVRSGSAPEYEVPRRRMECRDPGYGPLICEEK